MGGRGARSGRSKGTKDNPNGNPYGSQYHTLFEDREIKFVAKNSRQSEPLMETMTKGRVYVYTGGDDIINITFFDSENKRNKVIELDGRRHEWHAHSGYEHTELTGIQHEDLTETDKKIIDRVERLWKNYIAT